MLTKRLENILSLLPQVDTLADVGCDHGYVGIEALKRHIVSRVVFADISAPSLEKARQNCPDGLKTQVSFVCQDGLGEISCDCAVIAGMGGLEIMSVLEGAKTLPNYLVLQPMRNQTDVRKFLLENYEILSDFKFFDGKFYDLILAKRSDKKSVLTCDQLVFGKDNLQNPTQDFCMFLQKQKNTYENIIKQCHDAEVIKSYDDVCRILKLVTEERK